MEVRVVVISGTVYLIQRRVIEVLTGDRKFRLSKMDEFFYCVLPEGGQELESKEGKSYLSRTWFSFIQ